MLYPDGAYHVTQEKKWMSKSLMLTWIKQSLAPYVANPPNRIVPLLLLDSYSIHKMGSVNRTINDLGVEVVIIPPGCIGVMQPVDIGYKN